MSHESGDRQIDTNRFNMKTKNRRNVRRRYFRDRFHFSRNTMRSLEAPHGRDYSDEYLNTRIYPKKKKRRRYNSDEAGYYNYAQN